MLTAALTKEFALKDFVKNKYYSIEFATVKRADFQKALKTDKKELISENLNALI